MLSTNCSVGFLKQTAELSGAYGDEDRAFVEHLHRAYLTRLATIVGVSTERVVGLAHGYADKEPGFREFLVAQFHEEIEI